MNLDHCQLDHIGSGSLYGHVDGVAFSISTYGKVGAVNVFKPAFAAEQRFHIAIFLGKLHLAVHVLLYVGKLLFVIVDDLFCFATTDL